MAVVHRTALRKSRCDIIEVLLTDTSKLDSILEYLSANGHILTDSMLEIQSERTYRSRIMCLLDIIPKRGPHAYYLFFNYLKEHGFDTLRKLIIVNKNTNGDYKQQREYMPFYNLSQQKQNIDAQINGLERLECPICFAKEQNIFLNSCGHTFCEVCANTLFSMSQQCALYKSNIDGIQRVFI